MQPCLSAGGTFPPLQVEWILIKLLIQKIEWDGKNLHIFIYGEATSILEIILGRKKIMKINDNRWRLMKWFT